MDSITGTAEIRVKIDHSLDNVSIFIAGPQIAQKLLFNVLVYFHFNLPGLYLQYAGLATCISGYLSIY